ncbi:MAG: hypothetical protein AAGD05_15345, partial [Bacteroidota bacterium]
MSEQLYEKIEAYLNGTLAPAELQQFEAQLQTDPDLAAQLALFQNIDTALKDQSVLNFQKMVQQEGEAFLK